MIDALKGEEIVNKVGGRFKLCALIQRRLGQLMEGARPLVEREGRSDLELVIEEIMQGKIGVNETGVASPTGQIIEAAPQRRTRSSRHSDE
jgi:DNA-directed RNA polymerase subunit omega